jgi:ATP-binding cassette subfamily B protein
MAMDISTQLQLGLAYHMKTLPMGFFSSRDTGDLSVLLIRDPENLMNLLSVMLPQFIAGLIFPLVAVIILFFFDWRLSLCILIVILVAVLLVIGPQFILHWLGKKHHKAVNEANSRMLEYVEGIKPIKAFNLGGEHFDKFKQAANHLKKVSIQLEAGAGPMICLPGVILRGVLPAVVLTAVSLFQRGTLTAENFIIFASVSLRICDPLMMALTFMAEMTYMTISARRIQSVMELQPLTEPKSESNIRDFTIELDHVNFSYGAQQVLFDVCGHMAPGTMTALVGPSGSGKSTVTRLLARFWDVDSGRITVGGVALPDINTEDLMDRISVVFQDVYLFHDTVANNIALARPDATREDVEEAAKAAQCHEFIMNLPEQYDTLIGEAGNTLSGGEKQRISIARAILKDAPVVLLDEAMSSLDPQNEVLIQQAVSRLVQNKTLIMIAHRLQSIMGADGIIVLDRGRVVERGKHTDLLEQQGLYATLWRNQQQARGWRFRE